MSNKQDPSLDNTSPTDDAAQRSGDLSSLLGGILGGGARPEQASGASSGGDLGSLLGGLMGEQPAKPRKKPRKKPAAQPSGGGLDIGSLLQVFLGGLGHGSGGSSSSPTFASGAGVNPIVDALAKNLGIPPQLAEMVVGFALSKLLGGASGSGSGRQTQGFDMNSLSGMISSGQGIDPASIQNSGMAAELAEQTGMDEATAAHSLHTTFNLLGNQMAASGSTVTPAASPRRRAKGTPR